MLKNLALILLLMGVVIVINPPITLLMLSGLGTVAIMAYIIS